ncbi:uncharacterized protein LOC121793717 isoform X1 [Salvia splendens]|uniref:uncharacterized protein LOC121793717 isoform X1 n=1 Tax=Salvia splendens TaxID=180675 RepID=UPI001C25F1E4|nr:uncharacterized protein LOC121793717 isoform X1 [Salvia splendens]
MLALIEMTLRIRNVDVMKGTTEAESIVPDKDQPNHCGEQIPGVSCNLNIRPSPPGTVLFVACAPPTYISSPCPAPSPSPLTQVYWLDFEKLPDWLFVSCLLNQMFYCVFLFVLKGLYTIESSHMVQSMYQASNLTINQQSNPNIYEPSSFYTNQHHSPSHARFFQVSTFTPAIKIYCLLFIKAFSNLLCTSVMQDSLIHSQFQDPMSNGNQLKQVMDIQSCWCLGYKLGKFSMVLPEKDKLSGFNVLLYTVHGSVFLTDIKSVFPE